MSSYSYILYRATSSGPNALKTKQTLFNYLAKKNTSSSLFNVTTRPMSMSSISNNSEASSSSSSANNKDFKPKKSRAGLKLFTFALTGFTLGLGYVTLNPESRRQVEQQVPQSKMLFDFVDDMLKSIKSDSKTLESDRVEKKSIEKRIEKLEPLFPATAPVQRDEQSIVAPVKKPEKISEPVKAPAKLELQKEPVKEEKKESASKPTTVEPSRDFDWKSTMKSAELKTEATINAVEMKLSQMISDVKFRVNEALNSSYVSIESLNKYRQALRKALDDDTSSDLNADINQKELEWRKVTDLFDIQAKDISETDLKIALARKTIDDLDTLLREIKLNDELYKNVKNLREIQYELLNQARLLQAERTKLSETIIHANVLKNYTSELKLARNQFLREIQSLQPEGLNRTAASGDQLSNDELNSLLIHAHKRVLQLQKQIEKIQKKQNKQVQEALDEQQRQNVEFRKNNEKNLRELNEKEFQIEKDKIIENENLKAAEALKRELARQATAHTNHLAEMLRLQQDELDSQYQKKLLIEVERVRNEFYKSVASSLGRVKGIENALNKRANQEFQANNAKQLWLALQTLNDLLNTRLDEMKVETTDSSDLIGTLTKSVRLNLERIKESAPDNEFIQRIVTSTTSLIDAASQESARQENSRVEIWSEPELKERFYRLRNLCDRVALIDERGGSLFKYFISYVQSFFIIRQRVKPAPLSSTASDEEKLEAHEKIIRQIDASTLNTFNILDYAEYFVENGQFIMALKLMQQLSGEPLRVATDWINDALLFAEIQQASQLLNAYISSIYIGTKVNQK